MGQQSEQAFHAPELDQIGVQLGACRHRIELLQLLVQLQLRLQKLMIDGRTKRTRRMKEEEGRACVCVCCVCGGVVGLKIKKNVKINGNPCKKERLQRRLNSKEKDDRQRTKKTRQDLVRLVGVLNTKPLVLVDLLFKAKH